MKRILRYEFLFWILLSIGLFVFVLPIPTDVLVKIVAGYVLYSFIKEFFYRHIEQTERAERRIDILEGRVGHIPHKTSVYIHDHLEKETEADKKKKIDVRQYM